MTTIICNKEVMVSDSMITEAGLKNAGQKIYRVKGMLIGIAGNYNGGRKVIEWLRDRRKSKPEVEGIHLLILDKHGIYTMDDDLIKTEAENREFYAVGSGSHLAIGAVAAGASLLEAVSIACQYDEGSGGPVVEEILNG